MCLLVIDNKPVGHHVVRDLLIVVCQDLRQLLGILLGYTVGVVINIGDYGAAVLTVGTQTVIGCSWTMEGMSQVYKI